MKISIAMATYNGAKYLQEQLDSFAAQTRLPDELIICDDVSRDDTTEILSRFSQTAPFVVRVFRNEINLGYIKNFEQALTRCTGDIIFLSDQDDVWFKNKIEEMSNIFSQDKSIFVLLADMVLTDQDLTPTKYTQLGNIRSMGQSADTFLTGCGTAIRRSWLDLALPIPSDVTAHDNWIHRLALVLGVRALHEKPLQYYRRHTDNASMWLASKPEMVTELDSFLAHGFLNSTAGWQMELDRVHASWDRISESTQVLKNIELIDRQKIAILALETRIKAFNCRILNMTVPRHKRLPRVLTMWASGGYGYFAGWKSVAKDIVRR